MALNAEFAVTLPAKTAPGTAARGNAQHGAAFASLLDGASNQSQVRPLPQQRSAASLQTSQTDAGSASAPPSASTGAPGKFLSSSRVFVLPGKLPQAVATTQEPAGQAVPGRATKIGVAASPAHAPALPPKNAQPAAGPEAAALEGVAPQSAQGALAQQSPPTLAVGAASAFGMPQAQPPGPQGGSPAPHHPKRADVAVSGTAPSVALAAVAPAPLTGRPVEAAPAETLAGKLASAPAAELLQAPVPGLADQTGPVSQPVTAASAASLETSKVASATALAVAPESPGPRGAGALSSTEAAPKTSASLRLQDPAQRSPGIDPLGSAGIAGLAQASQTQTAQTAPPPTAAASMPHSLALAASQQPAQDNAGPGSRPSAARLQAASAASANAAVLTPPAATIGGAQAAITAAGASLPMPPGDHVADAAEAVTALPSFSASTQPDAAKPGAPAGQGLAHAIQENAMAPAPQPAPLPTGAQAGGVEQAALALPSGAATPPTSIASSAPASGQVTQAGAGGSRTEPGAPPREGRAATAPSAVVTPEPPSSALAGQGIAAQPAAQAAQLQAAMPEAAPAAANTQQVVTPRARAATQAAPTRPEAQPDPDATAALRHEAAVPQQPGVLPVTAAAPAMTAAASAGGEQAEAVPAPPAQPMAPAGAQHASGAPAAHEAAKQAAETASASASSPAATSVLAPADGSGSLQQASPQASLGAAEAGAASAAVQAAAAPASQPQAASPAHSASAAVPAPPADQVASAVAALHVGADGTSHVTVRLAPEELGQVEIRISRAQDGSSSINVAVERPETLATLQNDLGHLHQALDRAGVGDQRSISMHLATPQDASAASSGNAGLNTGAGFSSQGGSQQGARQDRQSAPSPAFTGETPQAASAPELAISRRAGPASGINITA